MFTIKMWRVLLFELIQARPSVRVVVPWVLCVPGWAGGSDWSTHRSNRPTLNPPAALRPPTRVLACQTPPARSVTVGCNSGADRARVLSMCRPASRRGRSSWMSLRRASHLLRSKLVRRTQVACSARYRAIHGVTHPTRTCVLKWGRAAVRSYSFNEAAIKSSDSVERSLFPRAGVITVAATRPGSTRLRGYLLCIGYETVHTGQGQTLRRKQLA